MTLEKLDEKIGTLKGYNVIRMDEFKGSSQSKFGINSTIDAIRLSDATTVAVIVNAL